MLIGNDHRARTMHTVAADTDRELFPTIVAGLLDRNNQRRAERARAWRRHTAQTVPATPACQRLTAATAGMTLSATAAASAPAIRATVSNCKTRKRLFSGCCQRRLRSLSRGGYRRLTLPSAATNP